jgi:hypothetical protein
VAGLLVAGKERGTVWRFGFAFAGLAAAWAAVLVVYTMANGSFGAMIGEWWAKYFEGRARFADEPLLRKVQAAGWFTLLAGGLPVLALPLAWRGDRIARWLALVALLWVGFFVLSPSKNIHYFFPAALLPLGVATRLALAPAAGAGSEAAGRTPALFAGALALSAVGAVLLCRPAPVPPYTADRDFGRQTYFLAGSEREAVEYSLLIRNLMQPLWRWQPGDPWTIGHHTWVLYADRGFEPARPYRIYVGRPPAPEDGLRVVTSVPDGERAPPTIWSRDGRAFFREWKAKEFPLRRDLSRFNFEM